MKRILITGGAGFIGSNFIRYLLQRKDVFVLNLDALTYAGHLENLQDVENRTQYRFCKGDICDKALVEALFAQYDFDTVIHFAAESHVDRSILGPQVFAQTNILGTQILLECARKAWGYDGTQTDDLRKDVKFVQISTDEVYGSLGAEGLFTEQTPLAPNSPYSASKASADLMALAYFHTYGMPINITRCTNNYGPYQHPEKLIPFMLYQGWKEKPLPIYGDGLQVRDWIYVQDHCAAVALVAEHGVAGEVYHIGANEEHTNMEIVEKILNFLQLPKSRIVHVTDRLGHDRRYGMDSSKIRTTLGWKPHMDFEQGMQQTMLWYAAHQNWVQSIIQRNG